MCKISKHRSVVRIILSSFSVKRYLQIVISNDVFLLLLWRAQSLSFYRLLPKFDWSCKRQFRSISRAFYTELTRAIEEMIIGDWTSSRIPRDSLIWIAVGESNLQCLAVMSSGSPKPTQIGKVVVRGHPVQKLGQITVVITIHNKVMQDSVLSRWSNMSAGETILEFPRFAHTWIHHCCIFLQSVSPKIHTWIWGLSKFQRDSAVQQDSPCHDH